MSLELGRLMLKIICGVCFYKSVDAWNNGISPSVFVSILRGCPRVKFCRTGSPCAAAGCVRQCARLLPRPSAAAGPYPVPKVLPTSSSSAPRFPAVAPRAVLPPRLRMVANVSLRQSRLLYRCEYVTSYAQGNPLPSAHLSPPRAVDNPCRQLMSSEK